MRLTSTERKAILEVFRDLDPSAEVYLFGSRADDSLQGGDIDLLVLSESLGFSAKITALTRLKERLGDQKIDLLIASHGKAANDPFVVSVRSGAVRIQGI